MRIKSETFYMIMRWLSLIMISVGVIGMLIRPNCLWCSLIFLSGILTLLVPIVIGMTVDLFYNKGAEK
jgi:hypothetical protein